MRFIRTLLFGTMILSLLASCEKDTVVVAKDNIDKLISADANLSLFKAALIKTNLTTFTQGPGPFTVFAPTNAAFNAVGINTEADLALVDPATLVAVITNHIQTGKRTSFEIPTGPNGTMAAVGGFTNFASVNTAGTFINGARVITKDIDAGNGIMHTIDRVLIPAANTVMTALALNTTTKLFLQAINKAAISAVFTANPITVFAPTNTAMAAAGYDSTSIANLNAAGITTLANILRYHVASGRGFQNDIRDGAVKTVHGSNIIFSASATKVKGISNAAPFNLTVVNGIASNGVIHLIDGVLKP